MKKKGYFESSKFHKDLRTQDGQDRFATSFKALEKVREMYDEWNNTKPRPPLPDALKNILLHHIEELQTNLERADSQKPPMECDTYMFYLAYLSSELLHCKDALPGICQQFETEEYLKFLHGVQFETARYIKKRFDVDFTSMETLLKKEFQRQMRLVREEHIEKNHKESIDSKQADEDFKKWKQNKKKETLPETVMVRSLELITKLDTILQEDKNATPGVNHLLDILSITYQVKKYKEAFEELNAYPEPTDELHDISIMHLKKFYGFTDRDIQENLVRQWQ